MKAGKQIKALRLAAGLTQKQLAELAGLAEITIRQYELNKREPKLEQLKKIASVLNVSVSELIDEFIPIIETFGKDVKIEIGNREIIKSFEKCLTPDYRTGICRALSKFESSRKTRGVEAHHRADTPRRIYKTRYNRSRSQIKLTERIVLHFLCLSQTPQPGRNKGELNDGIN